MVPMPAAVAKVPVLWESEIMAVRTLQEPAVLVAMVVLLVLTQVLVEMVLQGQHLAVEAVEAVLVLVVQIESEDLVIQVW